MLLWCTKLQFLKDIHNMFTSKPKGKKLLWCTKLQFLKDIHNHLLLYGCLDYVVMMYKVTIFERYTQPFITSLYHAISCYDVQSYNFWKIYTTIIQAVSPRISCYDVQSYNFWKIYTTNTSSSILWMPLLWCTKLQFLKDIHNVSRLVKPLLFVVMMYKVTIFERYTQLLEAQGAEEARCYDVQSYNFWKIYTTCS